LENEKIIEVKNLTKRFKNILAVNNLNLNVNRGDVFGFLGPNGAGKSTTIRMLLSLIFPTSGEIKIFGSNIKTDRNKILKRIGCIVEKPDFYKNLTAYRNLEILGRLSGIKPAKRDIMAILELVGLESRWNSKVKTYSSGMKQRLGIAQALLHNPELIILDEPTVGLDPQGMKEIRDLIINLRNEKQKTVFLSSHILHEVELVASRMIIIDKGSAVIEGTVDELIGGSDTKVTFDVDDIEKAKNILSSSAIKMKIDNENHNKLDISLKKVQVPVVNKLLVENNVSVNSIVPSHTLEELFIKLTSKE
jgi:ABC-type multidrug transport system ATPase subunit